MLQTIIAERITVSSPITETGYGVTTVRRVATRETVKRLQYTQDAFRMVRNAAGKMVRETYQKDYDYMVLERVSWYTPVEYVTEQKGSIQFGQSHQGITVLPDWAVEGVAV